MTRTVIVELRARPDQIDGFARLIDRHAYNSRSKEPDCLLFDVNQDPDDPARFVLVEVYKSPEAHAAHREMESFKWFMEEAPAYLVEAADGSLFHGRTVLERRNYISA
ncbi:MAG: putative quinol monooxygenase [Geminicoccaceae bacterium]|nr:putative quinol monooxygenase [Geminicoccaceae bacterium]